MNTYIYTILILLSGINLKAQSECDNITVNSYESSKVIARNTIRFINGYTTTGENGDIHAHIDPLAPCGGDIPSGFALNYIRVYIPIKDNATPDIPDYDNVNYTDWQKNTQFIDGLGRLIQTVSAKVSPEGRDMVLPVKYDDYGRQKEEYLPYYIDLETVGTESFRYDAIEEQEYFYDYFFNDGNNAKAEKEFDNSPLNRVLRQGAPGQDWQLNSEHTIDFEYTTNTAGEVKKWQVEENGNLNQAGFYAPNQLFKTVIIDENNKEFIEYKNKQGQVILKKSNDDSNSLETYFVYDDFGLLRYVIPPKASAEQSLTGGNYSENQIIYELCYYYKFDS